MAGKLGPWIERARDLAERATTRAIQLRDKVQTRLKNARAAEAEGSGKRDWILTAATWTERARKAIEKEVEKRGLSFFGTGATILFSTYFLADVMNLAFEQFIPEPPTPRALSGGQTLMRPQVSDYDAIVTRNLFNSKGLIPGEGSANPDSSAPVKTTLPVTLVGTVILLDESLSLATLEDKSAGKVYPLRAGDEVTGKLMVLRVEPRRIVFRNLSNQRNEYAELPDDNIQIATIQAVSTGPKKGIEQSGANHFTIPKSELDTALSPQNFNNLMHQALAVPYKDGGYQITQIAPGSLYESLGLKNNDVIQGFNGEPVSDPAKAFSILQNLKDLKGAELKVLRNGRPVNLSYDIQ